MPVKVFNNADIDFLTIQTFSPSSPFFGISWTPNHMEGDTGSHANGGGFAGSAFGVQGTAHDDATVPPVIVMTNVKMEFDWVMLTPGQIGLISFQTGASGHYVANETPFNYFGGTTRADLFTAGNVAWFYIIQAGTNPAQVAVSNFVLTVTYTSTSPAVAGISPAQGPLEGGTPVTISGSGFTGATSAKFGGASGTSFSVVNDNTITCNTPPRLTKPGPVTVTVT